MKKKHPLVSLSLTCMNALVDFEVFRSCKDLSASREWTGKWFLSRVDSDMVDKLVLGLERPQLPRAILPEASVVGDLRTSDVFHRDVGDNFV